MAQSWSVLTSGSSSSNSANTASIAPSYTPVLIAVAAAASFASPTINTPSGCNLTWTLVDSQDYASRRSLAIFKGEGTPTSGQISLSATGSGDTGMAWIVLQSDEIDSLGTPASNSGSSSVATVTVGGTPGGDDIALAFAAIEGDKNPAWEAAYSELADVSESGNVRRLTAAWDADAGDQTPRVTWSGNEGWGIIGFLVVGTAGGGGQTVAVNQVAETNTSQTVASLKAKAIAQISETDTPQAIARLKALAIAQVSETDLAQAITQNPINRLVNLVSESNTSQALSRLKTVSLAQASELDSAQAFSGLKTISLVQVVETEIAQAVGRLKAVTVAQVIETDLTQGLSRVKIAAVAQITEADSAQALSILKALAIGQATETDLAQAISLAGAQIIAVGQVIEMDAAQGIAQNPIHRLVGQVSENDAAQAMGALKALQINQVSETDLAQAVVRLKALEIAQAIETEQAQAISWAPKIRIIGQATEGDAAFAITLIGAVLLATIGTVTGPGRSGSVQSARVGSVISQNTGTVEGP